ncbi:MAG: peptidyl-prolyl cis-trans isomerase SurA [Holosporaceae bacterium]|jgi:peptidyl-prolyl cis-trans isomerase SurA|nr:peptidyl-prolyl cis-trans isomerase SurA [Holosporaceae bacterium]
MKNLLPVCWVLGLFMVAMANVGTAVSQKNKIVPQKSKVVVQRNNAAAQSAEYSKEYDGIVAVVNGHIITHGDLEERVRLVLFASGGRLSPELKARIYSEVLDEMVSEMLKWQCAKKYAKYAPKGGWVQESAVQSMFDEVAGRNNMKANEFEALLKRNNLSKDLLLRQIRVNLSWMEFVRARFGRSVNISSYEISRTMAEIKEKRHKASFYVHRMFFPAPDPTKEASVLSHVNSVRQMLANGSDFSNIARQFSRGPDAQRGGELGWVYQGQLSAEEDAALSRLAIGGYTVVRNSRGYVILYLRDRREAGQNAAVEVKFVQIILPFGSDRSKDTVEKLLDFVNDMRRSSRNCHEIITKAKDSGICALSEPLSMAVENMQPQFRPIVGGIPMGGFGPPMVTPDGIVVICVLDRKVHHIKDPTAEEVRAQKVGERLSVFAEQELQNLRKKAVVTINEKYELRHAAVL